MVLPRISMELRISEVTMGKREEFVDNRWREDWTGRKWEIPKLR